MNIINNIDTYISGEISHEELYKKYILLNKPCVIRNFYPITTKISKYYLDNSNNYTEGKIAHLPIGYHSDYPIDNYLLNIKMKPDTSFSKVVRSWKHQKNNRTRWHYDGNGINIFNICLSGSKRFYLNPPLSMATYPLSNIVINDKLDHDMYIDLNVSDMLFLPCFWMHSVITTSDNTFNINYIFLLDNNKITPRDKHMYTLHKMFNTYMCDNNDIEPCTRYGTNSKIESFLYGLYEMKIILIPLLFLFKFCSKRILYFITILSLILYSSTTLQKWSMGMFNLNAIYIAILALVKICYLSMN